MTRIVLLMTLALGSTAVSQQLAPPELPATAAAVLDASLKAAPPHARHIWRDTPPINADGTINAYVEIARGDRRKWEFDMAANARAIDRVIAEEIGGYPINYGFVPQTVSYDGDPFDVLVLGPPLAGGQLVRGLPVGVMFMEDEKGLDSKVVVAPVDAAGRPRYPLSAAVQRDVAEYFRGYKRLDPGGFSKVPGWGTAAEGLSLVRLTHTFFRECRGRTGMPCVVSQ